MDLPLGADDVLASVGFGFHESLIARPSKEMLMHKCNLVLNTRLSGGFGEGRTWRKRKIGGWKVWIFINK